MANDVTLSNQIASNDPFARTATLTLREALTFADEVTLLRQSHDFDHLEGYPVTVSPLDTKCGWLSE
jgi:hypothetical protein